MVQDEALWIALTASLHVWAKQRGRTIQASYPAPHQCTLASTMSCKATSSKIIPNYI